MSKQALKDRICAGCGAKIVPDLRYCVSCYRPVANEDGSQLHNRYARQLNTTRRIDPTIVFLTEEREARERHRARKKLIAIGTALALIVFIICVVAASIYNHNQQARKKALAREQMARRELNLLAEGLEMFKADIGRYPTDQEGIRALTIRPPSLNPADSAQPARWSGPYIDGVYEVDPWGNDYVYHATSDGQQFELFSYGPQGEAATNIYLRVTSLPPH
jgi:general secretion pathway protein G